MRKQLLFTAAALTLATVTLAGQTPAQAYDLAWCSTTRYSYGALNCAYYTLQQCQAYISGIGGQCSPNYRHLGTDARYVVPLDGGYVVPRRRARVYY